MRAYSDLLRTGARRAGTALLPAVVLLLGACASLKPVPGQPAPAQPVAGGALGTVSHARPQTLANYHGRFAVRYTDNNGTERNVYGNFDLQQSDTLATLQLLNPLGQTMARVVARAGSATLELPDRPVQTAGDVQGLMQRAIGFPLPIDGLRYWLQPAAAPDSPAQTRTDPASGRLAQIRQDGWTIDYVGYTDDTQPALIKRLNLNREDPALEVKLVLDR